MDVNPNIKVKKVNNYIVRSYRDVIVITNNVTRTTSKAWSIVMYKNTETLLNNINEINRLLVNLVQYYKMLLIMHTQYHIGPCTADQAYVGCRDKEEIKITKRCTTYIASQCVH